MEKLYWVESTLDVFIHQGVAYKRVPFLWIAARDRPVAPYDELIADYCNMDHYDRMGAEGFVDELLTLDEVTLLRAYLRERFHTDIVLEEYRIPVEARERGPAKELEPDDEIGLYKMSEESGYSLPLRVWGHYTVIDLETA